jgi:hypothetical protein
MSDSYLLLTPLLMLGVLAIGGFVGCDYFLDINHFTHEPPVPPPKLLVDFAIDPANPPTPRNDYSGWVGIVIQPYSDITLVSVGRWCLPTNGKPHDVKVVDATGADVPGTTVNVSLFGKAQQDWVFVDLVPPVTLTGGQTYYLVSEEVAGGDTFFEYTLTVTPSPDVQALSAAYADATLTPPEIYKTQGNPGNCYGPVSAQY